MEWSLPESLIAQILGIADGRDAAKCRCLGTLWEATGKLDHITRKVLMCYLIGYMHDVNLIGECPDYRLTVCFYAKALVYFGILE